MATRLYLHDAASSVSGTLPSTEQSSRTAALNYEAQTNNRSMNTSIGTSQATKSFVNTASRTNALGFVTKFISQPINQSGIAANTWTYNFASKNSATTNVDDYPVDDTANHKLPVTCYVWRPSTGAKVGNILDADVNNYYDTGAYNGGGTPHATTSEVAQHGTFSGSAVAGATTGDVIVLEAWIYCYVTNTTSVTLSYYYDGTTTNT